jgi:hypothetical protein
MRTEFWSKNFKGRDRMECVGVDGSEVGVCVDWIHLAQDGDHWWALVNTVMNLWVP